MATKKKTTTKAPTVKYSATTGKLLKKGETTVQDGKTLKQGDTYKSSSSSGGGSSSSSVSVKAPTPAAFNPNTGQPLKVGEVASKDGITYTGTATVAATAPKVAPTKSIAAPALPSLSPQGGGVSQTQALSNFQSGKWTADQYNKWAAAFASGNKNFNPEATATSSPIVPPTPTVIPDETIVQETPIVTPPDPVAPPEPALTTTASLQVGSKGNEVSQLQSLLGINTDGDFGPKTLAAVKAFQAANGLTVDGIVGPKTLAALNKSKVGPTPVDNVEDGAASKAITENNTEDPEGTEIPTTGNAQIDALIQTLNNQSPQKSFSDIYKEVYKELGVDTMKKSYEDATKEFSDLQDEKNDAAQDINNNPWFSEGVRVQKLQQLDKKYEGKELILQNRLKLLEANISNSRADAQFIAGQTMDQLQQSAKLNSDLIMKAIDIAEKLAEAEDGSSGPASVQEYQYAVKQGYKGTFSEYQNEDANRKISIAKAGAGGGLTPAQINSTVNSIAGAFDNEPIVKAYNTVQEGYKTISNIGVNTKSPADDIAFIYAFAKIMDPNSVVREGEYNTIQKYAQTWADNFGFSAKRIFSNTNFLTPDAKQKMLNALTPKVNTITNQYKNLESEYQRQVNDAYSGKPRVITNYAGNNTGSSSGGIPKGSMTGPQYVEKVLSSQGLKYTDVVSKIPRGQVGVINNQTGEIGLVPESEANSSNFTRIN